ncbi:MAG: 2-hydroxyacid dehydrogenase [Gammaproteobacteria bacterium]|nr:2-hydroxyacid dehydrogenase [Gammaproteobacteria bacterium]
MKVAIFSSKPFEKKYLIAANKTTSHELFFFDEALNERTVALAKDFSAVCCFVTDHINAEVINQLQKQGVKLIALRTAGFNHVDISAAKKAGLTVVRVPAYSPHSVAEFTVGLILALNRKIPQAYNRVREHNFLLDGLLGFDLKGKTVGVVGTGKIGSVFAKIMCGFECNVIGFDPVQNKDLIQLGIKYVSFEELCKKSDIISLHCPLNAQTHHIINAQALSLMQSNVMLINTGRGALIDTTAVIENLKNNKIGYLGLDVYEEEDNLFFQDLSHMRLKDEVFIRLQTFPNVLITGHQAFFTEEALTNIAKTTLNNIRDFEKSQLDVSSVVS